jgi:hypothetical protein
MQAEWGDDEGLSACARHCAKEQGLATVLDSIKRHAAGRHGWAWEPAFLLLDLVARVGNFEGLNKS